MIELVLTGSKLTQLIINLYMIKQNLSSIISILCILAVLITSLFVFNNILSSAESNINPKTSKN
jgi:hypothetical protein